MDEELKNRGWHELTFLDIAKSLKRGPFGGNLKKAFFVPSGYKVYEQQHAINKDFQLGTYFIDDKKYEELKGFAVGSGDYIISCSGTIGKLYRLPKEAPDGVINQALLKITLEDVLLTHSYFSYLFQSEYFQRQILSDARGTGMQNLAGMKEIKVVPVFIPPFPEQRKIVEKLDELISELDNGIANLKAAKDKLEIYRQAVLKKAFEGELTKEWREQQSDLPTADELLEQIKEERLNHYENQITEWEESVAKWEANGKQGKKPTKPKKFKNLRTIDNKLKEELIDIPDDWKWIPMGSIVNDIVVGYVGPIKKYLIDNEQEGVRFLSTTHIGEKGFIDHEVRYVTHHFNSNNKKSSVYPGDILIARHGDSGKACEIPTIIKNAQVSNAVIVRPNGILQYTPFVIYCFNFLKYFLRKKRVGGVQQVVNTTTMEAFAFPLNTKLEQQQIVQEIESRLSVCDNILANIEEGLEKSEALRQSILKKAFEGKLLSEEELEACRKEPDWEPAEKLLERIKNGDKVASKKVSHA